MLYRRTFAIKQTLTCRCIVYFTRWACFRAHVPSYLNMYLLKSISKYIWAVLFQFILYLPLIYPLLTQVSKGLNTTLVSEMPLRSVKYHSDDSSTPPISETLTKNISFCKWDPFSTSKLLMSADKCWKYKILEKILSSSWLKVLNC